MSCGLFTDKMLPPSIEFITQNSVELIKFSMPVQSEVMKIWSDYYASQDAITQPNPLHQETEDQ